MASIPSSRTLELLRRNGFYADMVERRVHKFVTKDFLGFIDMIGCSPTAGITVGIQATSRSNQSSRMKKVLESPELTENCLAFLQAGNFFEVWGWGKRNRKTQSGATKVVYTLTRTPCVLDGDSFYFDVKGREELEMSSELVFNYGSKKKA